MWFCYILKNENNKSTYNGSTNNPVRRLRQHSCILVGGAKATSRVPGIWSYIAILSGFPDKINALQAEWDFKCPTRKPGKRPNPFKNPNPGENPAPKAKKVSPEDAKEKVIDVIMQLLEK